MPVVGGAAAAVADWSELRTSGSDSPLFVAVGKGGRLRTTRFGVIDAEIGVSLAGRVGRTGFLPSS